MRELNVILGTDGDDGSISIGNRNSYSKVEEPRQMFSLFSNFVSDLLWENVINIDKDLYLDLSLDLDILRKKLEDAKSSYDNEMSKQPRVRIYHRDILPDSHICDVLYDFRLNIYDVIERTRSKMFEIIIETPNSYNASRLKVVNEIYDKLKQHNKTEEESQLKTNRSYSPFL